MAADPFGAHQVGVHIADHMAVDMRPAMMLLGVPADEARRHAQQAGRLRSEIFEIYHD